jgi:glycosyltransferase involved in cell wall biosynthesis
MLGPIPYAELHRIYDRCNAFLFTSLHDTSGNVLLEAMAHGLPIVTLDHHGAAEIVTAECGFKIPVRTASQVITDMATALGMLAKEPARARRMGSAGQGRVCDRFSWGHKGDLLAQVYDRVWADQTIGGKQPDSTLRSGNQRGAP